MGPSIWKKKLNPHHPRMLCAKCGWSWPSGSWEQDFINYVNVFSLFRYYLPLEKGVALHLKKLEFPSPNDALCQVWLKLGQWFLRRFLKFVNVFSLFHYYLTLDKGGALHSNKLESSLPKDALWRVWLKLTQWFLRRRVNVKSLQTDGQTDNRRSEKLTWAFSSGEL